MKSRKLYVKIRAKMIDSILISEIIQFLPAHVA